MGHFSDQPIILFSFNVEYHPKIKVFANSLQPKQLIDLNSYKNVIFITYETLMEIFNYTQFNEEIATSGQPLANEFSLIAESGYKYVINIAMHDSDDAVTNEGSIVASLGMSYFHIPVPFEAPKIEHLKLFIRLMECVKNEKVWVHCAANFRVSAFMYLYQKHMYGASGKEARSAIFEFWQPDEIWERFMEVTTEEIEL